MTKSAFERQAEQMRSQIDALRSSMDELQRNYNRWISHPGEFLSQASAPMGMAARTAKSTVESAAENVAEGNLPWWVPVAAIGVIGAGIWIYNMLSPRTQHELSREAHRAMHEMRHMGGEMTGTQTGNREQFPQYRTGEQPPFGTQTPPTTPRQP